MTTLLGVLLAACLIAAFGSSTLLYALYIYEYGNNPNALRGMVKPSGPQLLWALVQSLVAGPVTWLLYPLGFIPFFAKPSAKAPDHPDDPLIVVVHGLYHNPSASIVLRKRLAKHGFNRVYAVGYLSFGADFFRVLAKVDKQIEALRSRHAGRPLVLIGHSLGGLLVRALVSGRAGTEKNRQAVVAAVALGAPSHGSKVAALAVGALGKSLVYGGPLFTTLTAMDQGADVPALALYSAADEYVIPASACLPPAAAGFQTEALAVCSHISMLYRQDTARRIAAFLRANLAKGLAERDFSARSAPLRPSPATESPE